MLSLELEVNEWNESMELFRKDTGGALGEIPVPVLHHQPQPTWSGLGSDFLPPSAGYCCCSVLNSEAASFSETSLRFYQNTLHHVQDDSLLSHRCENLGCCIRVSPDPHSCNWSWPWAWCSRVAISVPLTEHVWKARSP